MGKKNAVKEDKHKTPARLFKACTVLVYALFLSTCMLLTTSCSTGTEPVEKQTAQVSTKQKKKTKKARKPKKSEQQVSEKKTVPEYSYDATGIPDPFIPLIADTAPVKTAVPRQRDQSEPLTPLQKYDLGELSLVAIISAEKKSRALLEDSSGFGFIVTEGTAVGKNDGIIKKITNNLVIIEEQIYNSSGELEPKIATLTIKHKE